jgi:hypothetical protein
MKYSLRSLMVVVLVGPPLLAVGWWVVQSAIAPVERAVFDSGTPAELDEAIRLYDKYLETHP